MLILIHRLRSTVSINISLVRLSKRAFLYNKNICVLNFILNLSAILAWLCNKSSMTWIWDVYVLPLQVVVHWVQQTDDKVTYTLINKYFGIYYINDKWALKRKKDINVTSLNNNWKNNFTTPSINQYGNNKTETSNPKILAANSLFYRANHSEVVNETTHSPIRQNDIKSKIVSTIIINLDKSVNGFNTTTSC